MLLIHEGFLSGIVLVAGHRQIAKPPFKNKDNYWPELKLVSFL